MKKIAMIPLRAGSKGIPNKNKKRILGRPLYQWVLGEAIFSDLDKIYIFSDDNQIIDEAKKEYFWTDKVEVIERSAESATDTATTSFAMLELAEKINFDFDLYCLIQATSPLLTTSDINRSLLQIEEKDYDSTLTVVENKRFVWSESGESLNYDYLNRPRRQDFKGMLIENGAFYAIKKSTFLETKNVLGGKIGLVRMSEDSLHEIDELLDWDIAEKLLINRELKRKKNSKIKFFIFDVDNLFVNGSLSVDEEGEMFNFFSLRYEIGLELLSLFGVEPVVITSESSPLVKKHLEKLKIKYLFLGVKDKYSMIEYFMREKGVERKEIAYIGDDIDDLANICSVGFSLAPIDAIDVVKENADYVLHHKGGHKAMREAIERIIKYNQRF